ncbi:MAG: hypothetical protein ACHP79_00070 [Terriglobales bacterium]
MLKRSLCLMVLLSPFLVAAQQPRTGQTFEQVSKVNIEDDETYSPHIEHPAFNKDGPVVLLDEGHGNPHFDKAFAKLVSADGYQVRVSRDKLTYEDLGKARILVIMNSGLFMPLSWLENPHPLFSDVEAAAVRDWVLGGGSLLFAPNTSKAEAGDMVLSRLGLELIYDPVSDPDLVTVSSATKSPFGSKAFVRERNMLASHGIMAGRSEAERVDTVMINGFKAFRNVPDNAIALFHCSGKANYTPRDALLKKQALEAARAVQTGPQTESQPLAGLRVAPIPVPGIPVAVAFTLGKGRVVVLGGSSPISSVVRETVFQGQKAVQTSGLKDADNQKFTLNTMHWLTGLME